MSIYQNLSNVLNAELIDKLVKSTVSDKIVKMLLFCVYAFVTPDRSALRNWVRFDWSRKCCIRKA